MDAFLRKVVEKREIEQSTIDLKGKCLICNGAPSQGALQDEKGAMTVCVTCGGRVAEERLNAREALVSQGLAAPLDLPKPAQRIHVVSDEGVKSQATSSAKVPAFRCTQCGKQMRSRNGVFHDRCSVCRGTHNVSKAERSRMSVAIVPAQPPPAEPSPTAAATVVSIQTVELPRATEPDVTDSVRKRYFAMMSALNLDGEQMLRDFMADCIGQARRAVEGSSELLTQIAANGQRL